MSINEILFGREIEYKYSDTKCPGFDKCPYEEVKEVIFQGFKDEPSSKYKDCKYHHFVGPTGVLLSNFTRKEFEDWQAQFYICKHQNELRTTRGKSP
jgi:hypothetical protein